MINNLFLIQRYQQPPGTANSAVPQVAAPPPERGAPPPYSGAPAGGPGHGYGEGRGHYNRSRGGGGAAAGGGGGGGERGGSGGGRGGDRRSWAPNQIQAGNRLVQQFSYSSMLHFVEESYPGFIL